MLALILKTGADYGALNPRFRHRLVKIRSNHNENCSGLQSKPERVRAVRLGFEKQKGDARISFLFFGADYGARTRHLDLGKVALYQMS